MTWLSRQALGRVLQSLLTAELTNSRRGRSQVAPVAADGLAWPESLAMGEVASPSLGCDSLERLWLAAAVNEMFCLYDAHIETSLLSAPLFGDWLDIVQAGWNGAGHRITFTTSGSKGTPKRCTHELADLRQEVDYLALCFGDVGRLVALAPPHHIYGFLFTAMLPTHLDVPVLGAGALPPGTLVRSLQSKDVIVSFPTRWEWLARSIPAWPEGVHGITSTAPCPEMLKRSLLAGGLAGFTEVYGSSETAGVGLRTFPAERYTRMPHWTLVDREAGPSILRDISGREVLLQDHLELAEDGTFLVKARVDGGVQVGGVNVFPSRLEELIRAMPGVAEAAVRLHSGHGKEGLKAFVVPDGSIPEAELAEELELWSQTLAATERVRSFTFGNALPRTAMGKFAEWSVG